MKKNIMVALVAIFALVCMSATAFSEANTTEYLEQMTIGFKIDEVTDEVILEMLLGTSEGGVILCRMKDELVESFYCTVPSGNVFRPCEPRLTGIDSKVLAKMNWKSLRLMGRGEFYGIDLPDGTMYESDESGFVIFIWKGEGLLLEATDGLE